MKNDEARRQAGSDTDHSRRFDDSTEVCRFRPVHREIATGGDPVEAVTVAVVGITETAGLSVWDVALGHDDGCPALRVGRLNACTCEILKIDCRRAA